MAPPLVASSLRATSFRWSLPLGVAARVWVCFLSAFSSAFNALPGTHQNLTGDQPKDWRAPTQETDKHIYFNLVDGLTVTLFFYLLFCRRGFHRLCGCLGRFSGRIILSRFCQSWLTCSVASCLSVRALEFTYGRMPLHGMLMVPTKGLVSSQTIIGVGHVISGPSTPSWRCISQT